MKRASLLFMIIIMLASLSACESEVKKADGNTAKATTAVSTTAAPDFNFNPGFPNERLYSTLQDVEKEELVKYCGKYDETVEFKDDGTTVITETDKDSGKKTLFIQNKDRTWTWQNEDGSDASLISKEWKGDNDCLKLIVKPSYDVSYIMYNETSVMLVVENATQKMAEDYVALLEKNGLKKEPSYGDDKEFSELLITNGHSISVVFNEEQKEYAIAIYKLPNP